MKADFVIQQPCPSQDGSLAGTIQQIASEQGWTRISVAVAYSSVAGITQLHDLVSRANPDISFRWLLGVDDYFTQPGAIELCVLKSKRSVRIYKSSKQTLRFHPKIYLFEGAARRKSPKPRSVLESDRAEKSPDAAEICWIEVGKNTALGRELEFKSEQARYFGLKPQGGMPEHKTFLVSNGEKVKLRLKYQANSMWRLQFTPEVPEFVAGLRPPAEGGKLGRSPYVAIFRRIKGNEEFKLSFTRVDSRMDRKIRSRSISNGTLGRTTAREYGWY